MAYIQWDAGSGSWGDAADWNGGVPVVVDTVAIDTANITVTIAAGTAAAAYSLSTVLSSTLDMSGGSLDTVDEGLFSGAFMQTGGTYVASGLGAIFYGSIDTALGGTITALAGATLTIVGGGILAGAITGTGALDFNGGTTYINTGFTSSITSININALVGLDINFSTSSDLTVGSGSLDLFGHTLTVSGNSIVDGTLGNGELKESGTLTLGNPGGLAYLDNGLIVDLTGKLIQSGNVTFGTSDAGAMMDISKTGQYLLNGNVSILDFSSVGSLVNAGTFAKTAGGKLSQVNVSTTSTGTINVETGTLLLNGLVNSLGGQVTGVGTLAVAGGQTTFAKKLTLGVAGFTQESGILVLANSLVYGGEWDMTGGILNLDNHKTTLTLSHADFDGGTLTGYGGTVLLGGTTEIANMLIGGPNTLTVLGTSTVYQTGNITLGESSNPTLNIDATGTWEIEGSSAINGPYGLIDNKGSFIDPNGSGTAVVGDEFESTGTVTVNNAALSFDGVATYLSGTVTGNGLLVLSGDTVLESGLGVSVTELAVNGDVIVAENLTYANNFSETYAGTVDLNGGSKLTLTGTVSLDGGSLRDGGTMTASGPMTLDGYSIIDSTLVLTGAAEQTGGVTLEGGNLLIESNSTYTIDDNDSIANFGGGSLTIAGNLLVDGYGQTSIDAIIDAAASIVVNGQTLTLNGVVSGTTDTGGSLGGSISGSGSLVLGGGTYTLASGLALSVAALAFDQAATVNLASNLSYAGNFADAGSIDITGAETMTLSGAAWFSLGSTLTGAGTLVLSGGATLSGMTINAGATLDLASATEQGPSNISDLGTVTIAAGNSYTLDANQSILGATGTLDVAGTLVASGDGVSLLQVGIVDAGVITTNLGTLDVLSPVGGSGKFLIAAGATLEFANSSTITSASTIQFEGNTSTAATLVLQNEPNFGAMVAGFTTIGDAIELYDFVGSGTLTVQDGGHQALITDSNNDSITLSFTSIQSTATLAIGMVNGHIALVHS